MSGQDVIVLGGSGFLGRQVVRKLKEHGRPVCIATRFPDRGTGLRDGRAYDVRQIQIDLRDRRTLTRAFDRADAVVNCIGHYVETGTDSFHGVHVKGAHAVAEIARTSGVRRLVHISGIGVDPNSESAYIRARADGEDAVRSAFPEAVILRPSIMFSRDGAFFGALDAIIRRMPVIPVFGDGGKRLQPVHVGDVAEAVCRVIGTRTTGTVFELGGPDVFTYREILERLAERAGRRRLLLPVPFALWRALARVASLLPRPPLTLAQVILMQRDNVVGNGVATFAEVSIVPRSASKMGLV
ncbi:complex I NDUFA9 subunit family protein [Defluviimonas salinarum]|uniref:Complex I NDUFA9 subunit family protein n=1 Tax=Defluviimonas salinarum TaxID=2992147 RepID=A0ABT3J5D9_9RHOB|nr:complex I NDUFA9 subunit family protein [Defluviimonas salinarum]MCW3782888.1 complex I NDUFA9 subunit family protein [Defluviimonas salinarum]